MRDRKRLDRASPCRTVGFIVDGVGAFCAQRKVGRLVSLDRIIGCPHEEGIDCPSGGACPRCPWRHDWDRCTGELLAPDDEGEEQR